MCIYIYILCVLDSCLQSTRVGQLAWRRSACVTCGLVLAMLSIVQIIMVTVTNVMLLLLLIIIIIIII